MSLRESLCCLSWRRRRQVCPFAAAAAAAAPFASPCLVLDSTELTRNVLDRIVWDGLAPVSSLALPLSFVSCDCSLDCSLDRSLDLPIRCASLQLGPMCGQVWCVGKPNQHPTRATHQSTSLFLFWFSFWFFDFPSPPPSRPFSVFHNVLLLVISARESRLIACRSIIGLGAIDNISSDLSQCINNRTS